MEYPSKIYLKVEYTKYPFERLFPVRKCEDLMVDSIQDILVNKLMAMTDRRDPKDYIDVYTIIQAYPSLRIEEAIGQAEKKFRVRGVGSILSGRFLELPICENVPLVKDIRSSDMQHFFNETARALIRWSIDE